METLKKIRTQQMERTLAAIVITVPTLMTIAAIASLWVRPLTWIDIVVFFAFYLFTALGVTLGYHRLLTHSSFKCTPWLKKLLTIAAAMSIQGPALWWVSHHRRHHAFSDKEHDVHSPHLSGNGFSGKLRGFLSAHLGWMLTGHKTSARKFAGALLNDEAILRIDRMYPLWILLSLILPAVVASFIAFVVVSASGLLSNIGTSQALLTGLQAVPSAALGGLLWGGFVRIFAVHHATWSVNSIGHLFGRRPFQTTDLSRNNLFVAIVAGGEGWHNAHHAFPTSARHGLLPGEFDLSWKCIQFFSRMGWAWDIKLPTEEEMAEKSSQKAQEPYLPKQASAKN